MDGMLAGKIVITAGFGLWSLINVYNHLADFRGSLQAVADFMRMTSRDAPPPIPSPLKKRAIESPLLHRLAFIAITIVHGALGALFFLGQAVIAFTLLEIVNYVEHYGLHRRKLDNGRYERTNAHHSWNSNFLLTNLFLFHLQRHSDHHAYAKRRYQVLRHFDDSPQLPNGYAGMIVLAVFPPLWRAVMDPKVRAYYAGEEHQLSESQPT